jgi:hypothetical protein|tara:strand:- start:2054 stop:2233 length:180 start_codon:yes stop_codon:yes gene_type:complete
MPYAKRIIHLESVHKNLHQQVKEIQNNEVFDDVQLHELKKKKLKIKDEIDRLSKLQQES